MCYCEPLECSKNLLIWNAHEDHRQDDHTPAIVGWRVLHCSDFDNLRALSDDLPVHAVLSSVDPGSAENLDELRLLVSILAPFMPLFMTYSNFNPRWIGNLMTQIGADMHFSSIPSLNTVIGTIEKNMFSTKCGPTLVIGTEQ